MSETDSFADEESAMEGPIFLRRYSARCQNISSNSSTLKIPVIIYDGSPMLDVRYPLELYGVVDIQSWYNIVRYVNECIIIASPVLQYYISAIEGHHFIYTWLSLAAILIVVALSRILGTSSPEPYTTIGCFFTPVALISIMALLVVRYTEVFGPLNNDLRRIRAARSAVKKINKLIKKDTNSVKKNLFPFSLNANEPRELHFTRKAIYEEYTEILPEEYLGWLVSAIEYSLFKLRLSLEHFKIYASLSYNHEVNDTERSVSIHVDFVLDDNLVVYKEPAIEDFEADQ